MPGTRESETRSRQRISIQDQRRGRRWLERDSRDSRGERDKGSAGPTGGVGGTGKPWPCQLLWPWASGGQWKVHIKGVWTTGSWHGHTLPPTVAFDVCSREGLRAH